MNGLLGLKGLGTEFAEVSRLQLIDLSHCIQIEFLERFKKVPNKQ